jgi:hypothetical protein
VDALSHAQVSEVVERFAPLNPYDQRQVPGSVLEIEKENFDPATGTQREIWCYSIASKRYTLFIYDQDCNPQIIAEQLDGVPLGPSRSKIDRLGHERVKEVPVESQLTGTMLIEGNREPYEAERREQKLVRQFVDDLEAQAHSVSRLQLRPDGEPAALFCDVYDKTTNTIYEAKGTVTRPAVRMAIGQLADYARLVEPAPAKALLVPQKPRE